MRLVADYQKDEVTLTMRLQEASDVMDALTVALAMFKRAGVPKDAVMVERHRLLLERLALLQADFWTELCEVDPSELN
jgi:hypothetical protein